MTKARVNADNASADIQGVTAGTGLSGGGTSGTVTLTNDMATTIAAKGDLVVGTGNDTYAALTAGNSGDTLVADSSASVGLRYQSNFAAGKNKIINGDFGIWQRGTSFSNPKGVFTADRWQHNYDGTGNLTISRQTFTLGSAPVAGYEGQYFFRVNQTTAGSGTTFNVTQHPIEDVRTFAGQKVTVSFWAKADSARTVNVAMVQTFGTGGSSSVGSGFVDVSVTTSWQRFSVTIDVPSIAGKTIGSSDFSACRLFFNLPVNTTFTIDFWGVQVEAGSVATAFQTATGTLAGELAACQRYHERTFSNDATAGGSKLAVYSDANYVGGIRWQVVKRVAPTVTIFSTNGGTSGNVRQVSNNTNYAISSIDTIGTMGFNLITGVGRSNMVDFHYVADAEL